MKPDRADSGPNIERDEPNAKTEHQRQKLLSIIGRVDTQIWIAVLGLFGTFIASPLAVQLYGQFQLPAISDKRRQTLEGRWEGTGIQILSEEDKKLFNTKSDVRKFPAHLNLSIAGRTINGTLEISSLNVEDEVNGRPINGQGNSNYIDHHITKHTEISYNLTGNMVASNYLRLDYVSRDPAVIEFGTLLLRLPSAGGELEGKYVSFGPLTERLVNGVYKFRQAR